MSGGASVPFTVLAVFIDNKWAQILFALCALFCAGFAAYRVWKSERQRVWELQQRVCELQETLAPKIELRFDGGGEPYIYEAEAVVIERPGGPMGVPAKCWMFIAENTGGIYLKSVKAQVISALTDDGQQLVPIPFSLARHHEEEHEVFPMRPSEKKPIDIISFVQTGTDRARARFAKWNTGRLDYTKEGSWLLLKPTTIDVAVLSEGPPATIRLRWEKVDDEWRVRRVD